MVEKGLLTNAPIVLLGAKETVQDNQWGMAFLNLGRLMQIVC